MHIPSCRLIAIAGMTLVAPVVDAAHYVFDTKSATITLEGGEEVDSVEGVPIEKIVSTSKALEFHFGASLQFEGTDRITCRGPLPTRIVVEGTVSIPNGMVVSASSSAAGPGAGGGAGGAEAPGGDAGFVVAAELLLRQNDDAINQGVGVPVRVGQGGQGASSSNGTADPGTAGEEGLVINLNERHRGHVGLRGGHGKETLGQQGWRAVSSTGYPEPLRVTGGGFDENEPYNPGWGAGGAGAAGGANGGFLGDGSTGGRGGNGGAGRNGRRGKDGPNGRPGRYARHASPALAGALIGGNGGNSGVAGSGGQGGASGGAGGGGGGGGRGGEPLPGASRGKGGEGGRGGTGGFGGFGGAGGAGGAGGHGGGAVEIRASGTVSIGGRLEATGGPGKPGRSGQAGREGFYSLWDLGFNPFPGTGDGFRGKSGEVVTGTDGGAGGRGGDGGAGGLGGNGGDGGDGAGGSGGTIVLRGATIQFAGGDAASHSDVRGGAGAGSAPAGEAGAVIVIPNPLPSIAPLTLNPTINRGESLSPITFTLRNDGHSSSTLNWELLSTPRPTSEPFSQTSGQLQGGQSTEVTFTLDTTTLGGGTYPYEIRLRDRDQSRYDEGSVATIHLEVLGPADDHGETPTTATLLPVGESSWSRNGTIEIAGDQDWFLFYVSHSNATVVAHSSGNTDTIGRLFSSDPSGDNPNLLIENDDAFGAADRNFRFLKEVTSGWHLLCVSAYADNTGPYSVTLELHPGTLPIRAWADVEKTTFDDVLRWDTHPGKSYRVVQSSDGILWSFHNNTTYSGNGFPRSVNLGRLASPLKLRVVEAHQPVFAARINTSSNEPGSTGVLSQTPGFTFAPGEPPQWGDTGLLLDGAPLPQSEGITVAQLASTPTSFQTIIQTPGELTQDPGALPQGAWISANTTSGSAVAHASAALAHFPFSAGWMGGYYVFGGTPYPVYNLPEGTAHASAGGGPQTHTIWFARQGFGFEPSKGALLVCGAGDSTPPVFGLSHSTNAYTVAARGTDGRGPFHALEFGYVFVPYQTPGIAAGHVLASGAVSGGTGNFNATWDASNSRYHLDFPGFGDASRASFIVTPHDSNSACHFNWKVAPGGGIDLYPLALPLADQTPRQCGFNFVFIPHDGIVLSPHQDSSDVVNAPVAPVILPLLTPPPVEIARGEDAPGSQLHFINDGTLNLDYTVTNLPFWLRTSRTSGSLAPGRGVILNLIFDTSTLGAGTYSANLVISTPNPRVESLTHTVTITVIGEPDDHGGRPASASDVVIEASKMGSAPGNIEISGDTDWFRFVPTEPGTLVVWTTGLTDTLGRLYEADGTSLLTEVDDEWYPRNLNFYMTHDVTPGTYLLCVHGYGVTTGEYTLHATFRPAGTPSQVWIDQSDGVPRVRWESQRGESYRLVASRDMDRWNYLDNLVFAGTGAPLSAEFLLDSGSRKFVRAIRNESKALFAAKLTASSSTAGSASVSGQTSGFTFTPGEPANFGDTTLLLDGAPLAQAHGVTIASIATSPGGFVTTVQAPGELSDHAPSFPQGAWLATNSPSGNEVSGIPLGLAHFPFAQGWTGGHIAADGSVFAVNGPPEWRFDPWDGVPGISFIYSDNNVYTQNTGALFVVASGNVGSPNIVTTGHSLAVGSALAWQIAIFDANGDQTALRDADYSYVYLPYTTRGIAAGHVRRDGSLIAGTGNATSTWNSQGEHYHLDIPGMGNLSEGVLLVNSADQDWIDFQFQNLPAHFSWRLAPGGGIDVFATGLPLSSVTPIQCGFVFAYIPFDRLVFPPSGP